MRLTSHRNLFNGDCNCMFYNPGMWQPEGGPYSARAIHRFVDTLADNGVDTFIINPSTQIAWYPSRAITTVLDGYTRGDREFFRGHAAASDLRSEAEWETYLSTLVQFLNLYLDLVEGGVDWLAETAAACRRRGLTPWVSVRMNDLHGGTKPEENYMNGPIFCDPDNRIPVPFFPGSFGLNYACPAVRDHMLSLIRELVEEYDFEGLELDWQRSPVCLDPEASQEGIDLITDWHAEVRALTERRAAQTGRPYRLGTRVAPTFDILRGIGLDVKAMARRGLLDFISPTDFWQCTWNMPYDRLREELGDEVAIYGMTEAGASGVHGYDPESGVRGIRFVSACRPLLYGNAAGKLVLGVDGIAQFNFFCADHGHGIPYAVKPAPAYEKMRADYAALQKVADLDALRGEPKQYTFSSVIGPYSLPVFELPADVPVFLEPGARKTLRLPMCAEPTNRGMELIIQAVFERGDALPDLGISFNGSWPRSDGEPGDELLFPVGPFTHHLPECQALSFRFDVAEIRRGWNEITIYHWGSEAQDADARRAGAVRIINLEAAVRPR